MRRKWWTAYFFLALVLTVGAIGLPLFVDMGAETAWWEWIYIPLYSIQIVGLFGFVFSRRLGVPPIWQAAFLASVIYEAWNWFLMASDPEVTDNSYVGFLISTAAATLIVQLPMLIGLFLYGFRCKELWRGAT